VFLSLSLLVQLCAHAGVVAQRRATSTHGEVSAAVAESDATVPLVPAGVWRSMFVRIGRGAVADDCGAVAAEVFDEMKRC
jgi:hypothetical protein